MENQETVSPESLDEVINTHADEPQETHHEDYEGSDKKQVPLHALQKERTKRKEIEERLRRLESKESQTEEDDSARYESATREELTKSQQQTIRIIEETRWAKDNPEKARQIEKDLPAFLKLKPNLVSAINGSINRYEEAWELMSKLSPRQKQQMTEAPKPNKAPGSPAGIPKAAAMNEAVDLMSMSDAEFNAWRNQQRRKR